ncbi:hypothetical protein [Kitasatospora sp. NPDC048538]|uniref:hypothetical protein n=1 Tax=unclassified Kitasatospora TaxID=2633591 RepID=UPI0033C75050
MARQAVPQRARWLAAAAAALCAAPACLLLAGGGEAVAGLVVLAAALPVAAPLAFRRDRIAFRTACGAAAVVAGLVTLLCMLLGLAVLGWLGLLAGAWICMFGPALVVLLAARHLARPMVRGRAVTALGWSAAALAAGTWVYPAVAPLVRPHVTQADGYVVVIGPDGPAVSRGIEAATWAAGEIGPGAQVLTLCMAGTGVADTRLLVRIRSGTPGGERDRIRTRAGALPGAVEVHEHHDGQHVTC